MMTSLMTRLFLVFFICASLICLSSAIPNHYSILSHDDLQKFPSEEQVFGLFQLWQKEHGRVYQNLQEEAHRFQIFQSNLKYINEMNAKRKSTLESRMGLNKFADWSSEEFGKIYLHEIKMPANWGNAKLNDDPCENLPDSVDWRTKGAVTEVKDQGDCQSHWAFSVTGAIEGINAINTGKLIGLSAQQLIDCDPASNGCAGGFYLNAFGWVINNGGIDTEADYPYTAKNGTCRDGNKVVSINNAYVVGTDSDLVCAVSTQPVTTSVDAVDFQLYTGGIYGGDNCTKNSSRTTLVVLIVGYGSENGVDYWIVKNLWGKNWGENGYIRIKRNAGSDWPYGVCGINWVAAYPTQATASATEPIGASSTPHLFRA